MSSHGVLLGLSPIQPDAAVGPFPLGSSYPSGRRSAAVMTLRDTPGLVTMPASNKSPQSHRSSLHHEFAASRSAAMEACARPWPAVAAELREACLASDAEWITRLLQECAAEQPRWARHQLANDVDVARRRLAQLMEATAAASALLRGYDLVRIHKSPSSGPGERTWDDGSVLGLRHAGGAGTAASGGNSSRMMASYAEVAHVVEEVERFLATTAGILPEGVYQELARTAAGLRRGSESPLQTKTAEEIDVVATGSSSSMLHRRASSPPSTSDRIDRHVGNRGRTAGVAVVEPRPTRDASAASAHSDLRPTGSAAEPRSVGLLQSGCAPYVSWEAQEHPPPQSPQGAAASSSALCDVDWSGPLHPARTADGPQHPVPPPPDRRNRPATPNAEVVVVARATRRTDQLVSMWHPFIQQGNEATAVLVVAQVDQRRALARHEVEDRSALLRHELQQRAMLRARCGQTYFRHDRPCSATPSCTTPPLATHAINLPHAHRSLLRPSGGANDDSALNSSSRYSPLLTPSPAPLQQRRHARDTPQVQAALVRRLQCWRRLEALQESEAEHRRDIVREWNATSFVHVQLATEGQRRSFHVPIVQTTTMPPSATSLPTVEERQSSPVSPSPRLEAPVPASPPPPPRPPIPMRLLRQIRAIEAEEVVRRVDLQRASFTELAQARHDVWRQAAVVAVQPTRLEALLLTTSDDD